MTTINIQNHKGIIFQIAKKMQSKYPSIDLDDIIQEINLLILQYADRYDSTKGTESTFITNFVGLKINQVLVYRYLDFHYDNEGEKRERVFMDKTSLNSKDDDGNEMINLITYDEETDYSEIKNIVETSNLTDKEKEVIKLRYLDNTMTLQEIGDLSGITKEAVRKLEEKALDKLFCSGRIKEIA